MTKTNRLAWGLAAILAVMLLGGAALLVFKVVSTNLRQTALVGAAKRGDVRAVQALLDHGVSVKARDHGKSAFEYAIELGDTRVVNAFLAHGASVTERGRGGSPR